MGTETPGPGVMGAEYAEGRVRAPHLTFRYRVRAQVAFDEYVRRRGRPGPIRVLDLGAAEGRTLLALRDLFGGAGEFHGVELSDGLLGAAPELPDGVELHRGDVMALPERILPESYDLVTILAVLEHLPDPGRCLREAWRALRPGGVLVATCPNPIWDEVAHTLGMVAAEHHEQHLDGRAMSRLLREASFGSVRFEPFMFAPVGLLPYFRIAIDPAWSLRVEERMRRRRLFRFAFVNQCVSGSKP